MRVRCQISLKFPTFVSPYKVFQVQCWRGAGAMLDLRKTCSVPQEQPQQYVAGDWSFLYLDLDDVGFLFKTGLEYSQTHTRIYFIQQHWSESVSSQYIVVSHVDTQCAVNETTPSMSKRRCELTDAFRKWSKLLHTLLAKRICKRT